MVDAGSVDGADELRVSIEEQASSQYVGVLPGEDINQETGETKAGSQTVSKLSEQTKAKRQHFNFKVKVGTVLPQEFVQHIVVKGFPLVGAYKVEHLDEQYVVLKPSCVVRLDDFPSAWRTIELSKLPTGMHSIIK